ncbi:hypothetical protein Adu01nite_21820 [Paractinoplanes durhamensis]|uniref:Uncharacterized protein n=1 Tax=Paractinoplanes durhamensis TaxID=113563 RepID=A0ABQ3YTH1_9ACTN|nr:hypothetical protein Adu01nite_21820 [Actinoplanes durhamensis]
MSGAPTLSQGNRRGTTSDVRCAIANRFGGSYRFLRDLARKNDPGAYADFGHLAESVERGPNRGR